MLSVIMLNVTFKPFMLSVVMLNVVMLSVVAFLKGSTRTDWPGNIRLGWYATTFSIMGIIGIFSMNSTQKNDT
jgi:hypothetical protein